MSGVIILEALWVTSIECNLIDRLGYRTNNKMRLWFLMVEVIKVIVIIRVIHRVGRKIIREIVMEIKVMVIHGRVEHILPGRFPSLMVDLTIMSF